MNTLRTASSSPFQSSRWRGLIAASFSLATLLAGVFYGGVSQAQVNTCVGTGFGCTAGEFGLPTLSVTQIIDPCEFVGDTATVKMRATFSSNTNRYDIGLFVALDGGDAQTGSCQRSILRPLATPCGNSGSPLTGAGPFYNGECGDAADTCGDVEGTPTYFDQTVTIACRDYDADGTVDVATLISWNQNQQTTCNDANPPGPGTSSKCNRGTLSNITGLPVPQQTIEVIKVLSPIDDPGLFDLYIDHATLPTSDFTLEDAGHLGRTGAIDVEPGNFVVGELAGTATLLSDYVATITCVDNVGRCSNAPATRCSSNAACGAGTCNMTPTTLATCTGAACNSVAFTLPDEQAAITCTITNTHSACNASQCNDNSACTTDTCDPIGGCVYTPVAEFTACGSSDATDCNAADSCNAVGACVDRKDPATTVCRNAAGACDVAETCTGLANACPADAFAGSAVTCTGTSQGGACDNDAADHCVGNANTCVDSFRAASFTCRADTGQCDVAETCTGSSGACPADAFEPPGTSCSDGDACSTGDGCVANACVPTGTVNVDDSDLCTNDSCNSTTGVVAHELVDPNCCSDNLDCPTGACNLATNRCVVCVNTGAPGAVDDGCQSVVNACDTAVANGPGTTCVDCLETADCSVTGDVCNTATKDCVPCNDSGPGAQDEGCESTTLNACLGGGSDNATCVDCTVNADCQNSQVCKTTTNTCVECVTNADCNNGEVCDVAAGVCESCIDTASFPGIDAGCVLAEPVCVQQGAISGSGGATVRSCVVCEDNKPLDTQVDEGCRTGHPICDEGVPGGRCVECNDATDCAQGEACDTVSGTCVACLDDRLAGTVDSGCDADLPVCDLGAPGLADDHCVACEDDRPAGITDWGCDAVTPYCDVSGAGDPHCIACERDEDCSELELCRSGVCIDPGATRAIDDAYTTSIGVTLTISAPAFGVIANDQSPPGSTLSVAVVAGDGPSAAEGVLTLAANGTFTFVPAAGYAGSVTFGYRLSNGLNGATSDATVTIVVNGPPRPQDDVVTTPEDTALTFDPRVNDSDPNSANTTLVITRIVSGPAHGGASANGTSIAYVPDPDYSGPDALVYEVCDPTNLCASATVAIGVTPVNDRPNAGDDLVATPEDTGVLIVVLANDVDSDSPILEVGGITSPPSHGTAVIQPDDTVLYVPVANYVGTDAFRYEACDPEGLCDEAVVLVTVSPVNDGPVAGDDKTSTASGVTVVVPVLANDSDIDGDPLEVTRIVLPPGSGSAAIEADGTIRYTPGAVAGVVTFSYEVCDAELCDIATVTVTVGSDDAPPDVADDTGTTPIGAPVRVDVLANDDDPDGDPLTVEQVGQPSTGTVTLNPDGTVTFTPAPGFTGEAMFTYTACDDAGACETAVVTITVVPGDNRPPIATDDVVSTRTDVPVSLDPTDNDVDPDADPLAVEDITLGPLHGTAELESDGSVTYTPDPGFVGTDAFEVSISDGQGGFDRSTVTVVVAPDDNVAPVARDDAFDVPASGASNLDVMVNDSDPNGDPIVIVDVVQPSQGVVTIIVESGVTRLVFTPDPGASGSDSFTYTISDGRGGESQATVTLTFPVDNLPPIAVGESVITPEDTAVLIVVLANDTDPDGDPLEVTRFPIPPRHGTVVIDAGGGVLYTPDADYVGPDVFTYEACDDRGACDTAVVSVAVTAVNDAPRANDDFYAVPTGETSVLDVVLNDSDPELDPLAVTRIVSAPDVGYAYANPDGTVTYEPAGVGTHTFVYEVCDDKGLCDTATVTVFVGSDNHNPLPEDDEAETIADAPVTIDVLENDSDPDGDTLTLRQVEDPAHGTAVIEDGAIVYTPDEDFVGADIFFYLACDSEGACAPAFVIVEVTPGDNTPPTAVDDTIGTIEGTPVTFDSTLNDVDVDGDNLTVIAAGDPVHGEVTINPDGTLTYTPDTGYTGEDNFTVTISDGRGGTSTQNVLVVVTPADNQPPDAIDDSYDAPSDVDTILPVLSNDVDPDADPLTIVDVVQPQHGTVAIGADGNLVLTPDPAYIGPDRFSYTVSDGNGGFDTAYVDLYIGDRDRDGLGDGHEVLVTHTDPDDFDSDNDGVGDGAEVAGGEDPIRYDEGVDLDPLDADTDDDGLADGTEIAGGGPLSAPTDPLDADTDGDGVADGVEVGVVQPVLPGVTDESGVPFSGTDTSVWIPDADIGTRTDPLDDDSDEDGIIDGGEDLNGNGARDGELGATGTPGSGETDPANPDTDGDGIQDGTELGLIEPQGTGTDIAEFQPDLDPATTTDPRDTDSDDGGVRDGDEDLNSNGYQDPDEIDPNYGTDDSATPLQFLAEGGGCGAGGAIGAAFGLFCVVLIGSRRRRSERGIIDG